MFESINEAFSRQSEIFDDYEKRNEILKWMRSVTHKHILRHLRENDIILELNSGTGIDAVFFSTRGFRVHCIDISEGMIRKLGEKVNSLKLNNFISYELLSFTELHKLEKKSFDYIFSNFGGLNCAPDLSLLFGQFRTILKPGGRVSLVMIPPVCPWEIALLFKGKFKTAFRRLKKGSVIANVEGINFPVYYYSVSDTAKALGPDFRIIEIQGLASISPPPYMENFPNRYPRLYQKLTYLDEKFSRYFPFNRYADHFILTAEFKPE
jgi:ubiquinone/menaquinone biosynthesis C-methylase UbiE